MQFGNENMQAVTFIEH